MGGSYRAYEGDTTRSLDYRSHGLGFGWFRLQGFPKPTLNPKP